MQPHRLCLSNRHRHLRRNTTPIGTPAKWPSSTIARLEKSVNGKKKSQTPVSLNQLRRRRSMNHEKLLMKRSETRSLARARSPQVLQRRSFQKKTLGPSGFVKANPSHLSGKSLRLLSLGKKCRTNSLARCQNHSRLSPQPPLLSRCCLNRRTQAARFEPTTDRPQRSHAPVLWLASIGYGLGLCPLSVLVLRPRDPSSSQS